MAFLQVPPGAGPGGAGPGPGGGAGPEQGGILPDAAMYAAVANPAPTLYQTEVVPWVPDSGVPASWQPIDTVCPWLSSPALALLADDVAWTYR